MANLNENEKLFKKRLADYRHRKRILDQVAKDAAEHRFAFVRDLDPAKAETLVGPLAVLYARWGTSLNWIDERHFCQLLDMETLLTEDLMHNTYCTNPGYIILALIASNDFPNDYHFANPLDQTVSWKGENILANPADLEDVYRILIALGYEQTEEEKQWRNGTHFAYDNIINNPN